AVVELLEADPEAIGDLPVLGLASELTLQLADGRLDLLGLLSDGARDPVQRPQTVDHTAADAPCSIRLKLHLAAGIKTLQGVGQAEETVADEIVHIHRGGQSDGNPVRDVLDEGCVSQQQKLSRPGITVLLICGPSLVNFVGCELRQGIPPTELPSSCFNWTPKRVFLSYFTSLRSRATVRRRAQLRPLRCLRGRLGLW